MLWEDVAAERDPNWFGEVALDDQLRLIYVSDGVLAITSSTREELIGTPAVDLVHPDELDRAIEVLREVGEIPGRRPGGQYRLHVGGGMYRTFTIRATNLAEFSPDQQLGFAAYVLEFHHPTPHSRAQALADDVVDTMRMFAMEISLEEGLDWISSVAERHIEGLRIVITLFEADGPNQVISRHPLADTVRDVNLGASPDALPLHVDAALQELERGPWRSSRKIAFPDFIVPGRLTSILRDSAGATVGYVEALRPSNEAPDDAEWLVHGMISRMMNAALKRHDFDRKLRRAAEVDALTGLLNRGKLFELLEGDEEHLPGSLLYLIDLDRFSWVNNNLGHRVGDETVVAVADTLTQVCPSDAVIARLGGDEFVVWVPASVADHDLEQLGRQISAAMAIPVGAGDRRVWVRASIGMIRVAAGESAADALNRADVAMYASKRSGGGGATVG